MNIKDMESYIGIYYVINNTVYTSQKTIDNHFVNGMNEAPELFHYELLRQIPDQDPSLPEDLKNKLRKSTSSNTTDYPRGRVGYNINEDKFHIWGPIQILKNENIISTIIRHFHLPRNKVVLEADPFYQYEGEI